ncbi:branched-chain amino acid ABC transporter substrate-binding protein [Sulfuritalea sp.]|uniref:branched-chain amino acid ABC transporter substrate-binding protein n=1 Tax=Sulfuritalea sp. TaxID=2480090 RepID=UPI001AC81C46|nr:branched-chain amino acid ABC transporter substrate-binding protein [Sulfuritalea sp.]MBN8475918.1 branched-chain amino acid ABC transporter substrate-binding protein [Sulfuritalea sp.]
MKSPLFNRLALAASVMLVGGSACAQVKIAYIDPLSGPFANVGEAGLKGFKEAAEILVNQKGGIMGQKLEFTGFDNKGSPQETQLQLKAAIDQGFRFVTLGNGSGAAHSLIDAVNKWNARNPDKTVLFFNYAAVDPTLTNEKCSFWHFRFDANTEMKMEAISNFMEKDKTIKKLFIIGQDYAHGHQVAKYTKEMLAAKRKDIKIVGEDLHPIGRVKDFAPYIAKIKASGADTVMTGNWGNDLSLLIKAAKDAGLKARFFTYYAGGLGTPQAMGAAGENQVIQLTEWHMNVPTKNTEKFALDFNKKYPGVWFYYLRVNNMVQMVAQAMNTAKSTDPKAVALALEDMRMPVDTGEVWMRKSDHQAMQPLYISIFSKADGKTVKHDSEGTGYGWKTLATISQRDSQLPTSCIMERP